MNCHNCKAKASVTVFFSLVFTVILALICTVLESARIYAAHVRTKSITYTAIESEFAGYSRQIFEEYGALVLWEEIDLGDKLKKRIDENNIMADKELDTYRFDVLRLNLNSVEKKDLVYATDNGGDEFAQQILSYEKYEVAGEIIEGILQQYNAYSSNSDVNELLNTDTVEKCNELTSEKGQLIELSDKFKKSIEGVESDKLKDGYSIFKEKIKNLYDKSAGNDKKENNKTESETFSDGDIKKLIKYFKNLRKKLREFDEEVVNALTVSQDYITLKNELIKEYGSEYFQNNEQDYIQVNNGILTDIHNYIKTSKEIINMAIKQMDEGDINNKKIIEKDYIEPIQNNVEAILQSTTQLKGKKATDADKEITNIFKFAKNLVETGILELVLPDNIEISPAVIEGEKPSDKSEYGKQRPLNNIANKIMFVQYLDNTFSCFMDEKVEDALQYEMEYVLSGAISDKENLISTVTQISLIRQALNTTHILTDSEKLSICSSMALSISTAIGLPVIEPLIKIILIQAWAIAETVLDIKFLLRGENVPLIKNKAQWSTSINGLTECLAQGKDTSGGSYENSEGISYEMYLKLLLLIQEDKNLIYRTMDLIQFNVNKKYNSEFRMDHSIISANVDVYYGVNSVFVMLPIVRNLLNLENEIYEFDVYANYSYIN